MAGLKIEVTPDLSVVVRCPLGWPYKPITAVENPSVTAGQVLSAMNKLAEQRKVAMLELEKISARMTDLGTVLEGLLNQMRERGELT